MEIQNDNTNCSMQPWLQYGRLLLMGNNKKIQYFGDNQTNHTINTIQNKINLCKLIFLKTIHTPVKRKLNLLKHR